MVFYTESLVKTWRNDSEPLEVQGCLPPNFKPYVIDFQQTDNGLFNKCLLEITEGGLCKQ